MTKGNDTVNVSGDLGQNQETQDLGFGGFKLALLCVQQWSNLLDAINVRRLRAARDMFENRKAVGAFAC